jgi:hypothetical protein
MLKTILFVFIVLFSTANSIAGTNDCDGDCTHKGFETKVLPNRKPAVVLQEEIENITKVGRSPAVVQEEDPDQQKEREKEKEKGATIPLVRHRDNH